MLKGFINKNGLDSEAAEQRLAAIEKLNDPASDEQSQLQQLVLEDPDERVRQAALQKITALKQLVSLLDNAAGEFKESVKSRIADVLESGCPESEAQELVVTASDSFKVLVISSSVSDGLRNDVLDSVSDESLLADIACDAKVHQTRMLAAEKIITPDGQSACLARVRNRDKQVARMLQAKVTERSKVAEQQRMHDASVHQLLNAIDNLAGSAWSPQYAGQFTATEQRWQALDPKPTSEQQTRYATAREKAAEKVEGFREQQERLATLSTLLDEAEEALEVLTSAKLSSLEAASVKAAQAAKSLPERWQQADIPSGIENPFEKDFQTALTTLQKLTPFSVDLVDASVHSLANRKVQSKDSDSVSEPSTPVQSETAGESHSQADDNKTDEPSNVAVAEIEATAVPASASADDQPAVDKNDASSANDSGQQAVTKQPDTSRDAVTLGEDQRRTIEKALNDELFAAQMACTPQLRSQLGKLDETLEKARQEQAQLADGIRRQLNALAVNIDAGKWSAAEGMSKRIERKLEQLQGDQLPPLQQRYEKQRRKLDELADWQDFAALPKLQNLVESMRLLPGKELKPRQLADEIKALQNTWKSLGSSRVANQLWDDFKTASDVAYEPCKVYFDGLKKQRESRIRNREIVCERMQACLDQAVDPDAVNTREVEKLLSQCHREWRNNRPSGRKPHKQLEERFSDLLGRLEALLAPRYEAGIAERQELIEKARKLAENETSNQHVINQAKSLQAAWKLCASAGRKNDQNLWTEFNELCGQIFNRHRKEQRDQYKASMGHVDRAREIIRSIRQLARQPDDKAEQQLTELQDEFQGLAEFPEKLRKSLVRDFRSAGDAFSRERSSQGGKRKAAEMQALRELAQLCEQIERGDVDWVAPSATAASDEVDNKEKESAPVTDEASVSDKADDSAQQPDDSSDDKTSTGSVSMDDPFEVWESYSVQIPKPWLKRMTTRRDAAIRARDAGKSPFSDSQDESRRLHCIQLEIMCDLESPAEDRTMRMQYQLQQLQSGPDSNLLNKDAKSLKEHTVQWLCMAPASPGIAASLEQRFKQAMDSTVKTGKEKNVKERKGKQRKKTGKPV